MRRAGPAETGCPKKGELKLPTGLPKLTRFRTLNTSTANVALGPFSFFFLFPFRRNSFDQRISSVAEPGPSKLFLRTPGGRSLAKPSRLSSRPVVRLNGRPERAENPIPSLKNLPGFNVP